MNLVSIFVQNNFGDDGLYSVQYPGQADEFTRLFDQWNDIEYLEGFFQNNIYDLTSSRYPTDVEAIIQRAVIEVLKEAAEFEDRLLELVENGFKGTGENLQHLFKPLDNWVYELLPLQKSKASFKTKGRPSPKLRIYAIRLASNLYIVTGGGIKLTRTMQESPHLMEELRKIERVRQWLKTNEVTEADDLNDLI